MGTPDTILVETTDGIATVTLNRPKARNAFDAQMVAGLTERFQALGADPKVRGVVLAGAGPIFCAGVDLNWMAQSSGGERDRVRDAELLMRMYRAIDDCPVPVVARVQGAAYGGGVGLVAVCDLVVAAEDAWFALREVRVGLVPAVIAPFMLRKVGDSQLRRFSVTGESFSAQVAKTIGLVHDVVPGKDLDGAVRELADHLLQGGPQAVRATKALLRQLSTVSPDERGTLCIQANARIRGTDEAREGMRAFAEKRPPAWLPQSSKKGTGR